eukprot:TRINITY_DN6404_c0_g1_i1.p1 TRINITY_DN6404_c0_g1~~TRINITY_DN6404_c0_g1_i1.p1  ORF type:complete len:722 (-),score=96.68 TRINITY_DN6404_c0_g1_i1:126-2222(-)
MILALSFSACLFLAVANESESFACKDAECDDADGMRVELLQQRLNRNKVTRGKGWSILNPDPEKLKWRFRGYYWKGDIETLPSGAFDAGLCVFAKLDRGIARSACTAGEKAKFVKDFGLKETDFYETLVGYLFVPLEYDELKSSSNITMKLRVSMFLGPAGARAPLLLRHCGGPSSCDLCAMTNGEDKAVLDTFTFVGIQQRGMGTYDTSPAGHYPHPDHAVDIEGKTLDGVCQGSHNLEPDVEADKEYSLRDFTTCVCDLPEDPGMAIPEPFPAADDEEKVRAWFAFSASRDRACYNADYWKLHAGESTYNFLDFVGTQVLAMDLDRLREAVGHDKLNILGYSYGTAVGASYLATFPQHSGNVVLNGNVHPGPGVDDYYQSVADAARQGMAKLVMICDRQSTFVDEKTLEECQVPSADPLGFFQNVVRMIKANASQSDSVPWAYSLKTRSGKVFTLTPEMLYHYLARMASSRATDQGMWVESLQTIIKLGSARFEDINEATSTIVEHACTYNYRRNGATHSVRAWYDYNYCWPVMFNTIETNDNCITSRAVRAADYTNRFTIEGAMDTYRRLRREYHPLEVYFANAKAGFGLQTWPADAAPGMYGFRADVSPFIINSLYDMSTPYSNAKLMRQGFPSGVLVTWQGVGHCVKDADFDEAGVKSCIERQTKYLLTGELPPDGFTCHQTQYINAGSVTPH